MGSLLREMTDEYQEYLRDESHTVGWAEQIAFPRTEEEVRQVLRQAWERDLPVTLQGGRTGISAGCVPHGGVVVSLARMTRAEGCRALGDGRFSFLVQPGVVLSEFGKWVESKRFDTRGWDRESLAAYGGFCRSGEFFFTPDPTERSACIGGMAACNASGARSYLYGPTRPHILSLRAVLMDGRTVALRRGERFAHGLTFELPCEDGSVLKGTLPTYTMPPTKNTSGYYCTPDMDLMDLFIGSDGTLAALTQLEVALVPSPAFQWCVNAYFMEEDQAMTFVKAVRDGGEKAAAIEYFDGDALDILRRQRAENPAFSALPPVPDGAAAAVCVELHDDDRSHIQARLFRLGEQLTAAGGREEDTQVARTRRRCGHPEIFPPRRAGEREHAHRPAQKAGPGDHQAGHRHGGARRQAGPGGGPVPPGTAGDGPGVGGVGPCGQQPSPCEHPPPERGGLPPGEGAVCRLGPGGDRHGGARCPPSTPWARPRRIFWRSCTARRTSRRCGR